MYDICAVQYPVRDLFFECAPTAMFLYMIMKGPREQEISETLTIISTLSVVYFFEENRLFLCTYCILIRASLGNYPVTFLAQSTVHMFIVAR